MRDVTVYGVDSCKDTQRALELLTRNHVSHLYRNVEREPLAKQLVEAWYPGAVRTPIVVIEMDGTRLVKPTEGQLTSTLVSVGLIRRAA